MKKRLVKQLERFKTEINLVEYAQSFGYKYLQRESDPNSAVLRHGSGDKLLVATDTDGRGIYFSLNNDGDRGTIIDFVQRSRNLNLGEVRKELRPWLVKGGRHAVGLVTKPEPINIDRINECLQRLKNLNQSPTQTSKSKPRPKKRRTLEL